LKRTFLALVSLLICLHLAAVCGLAQNSTPSQPPDQSAQKPSAGQPAQSPGEASQNQNKDQSVKDQPQPSDAAQSGTSKDRLFFALPNFLTVENASQFPPLTVKQKYGVVGRSAFDPVEFVWYGALAGISQAENSEQGFGQGAQGYGKRYGAYFADGTIENFFVGAIFPAMLHQDPRYFQNGQGSFFHRTGYAMSRIFVTRTDSKQSQFNYSEIVGAAVASAISTYSYHPHPGYHPVAGENVPYIASDRTLQNTLSVWGSQVGYDTLTLVIKEFWPDVRRRIKKKPHWAVDSAAPAPGDH